VLRADNLATFMCRLSRNSGSLNVVEPSGPLQNCIGIALPSAVAVVVIVVVVVAVVVAVVAVVVVIVAAVMVVVVVL
jgi:hypothetical protein